MFLRDFPFLRSQCGSRELLSFVGALQSVMIQYILQIIFIVHLSSSFLQSGSACAGLSGAQQTACVVEKITSLVNQPQLLGSNGKVLKCNSIVVSLGQMLYNFTFKQSN